MGTMEDSTIPAETAESSLPETTVSATIDNAFGGTINDAEKARETSSPWAFGDAPAPALESGAPESPSEEVDMSEEPEEEEKPRRGRAKMTPEERAARDQKKHEMRLREADAYLRAANMFWVGRCNAQLKDLLNPDQLKAELNEQNMSDKERGELAEPLADVLQEEGVETSPTTRLMLVAFAIYAPKMERLKTVKNALEPKP